MLDRILSLIAEKLKDSITLHAPTLTTAVNAGASWLRYVQFGKIVIFTGAIATTSSLSAGTILATGFPQSFAANAPFTMMDNNSSSSFVTAYINNADGTGKLRMAAATSGNRSWRISGVYISQ